MFVVAARIFPVPGRVSSSVDRSLKRPAAGGSRRRPRLPVVAASSERRSPAGRKLPSIQLRGSAARLEVMRPNPLFRIGLFADAQYADRDDFERPTEPGRIKYFRAAPERLAAALADFRSNGESMACIVNLGDIIDGANDDDVTAEVPTRKGPLPDDITARNRADLHVMAEVVRKGAGPIPVYHCLGNHDLNLPRAEVTRTLGNPGGEAYFTRKLPRGWRLIVLDTTEMNPRYLDPGSEAQASGEAFVRDAKRNKATNAAASGGPGGEQYVKPWGGGVGPEQLSWLTTQLRLAEEANERVLVASHAALSATGARPGMAAWNAGDLAALLEGSPAVALCIAGHDHPGGYGRTLVKDRDGLNTFGRVHYVTLEAMLEAPEGSTSYAVLEVYEHDVAVVGVGSATSRRLQVSPNGVFTGVANFGRAMDVMEGSVTSDGVSVERTEMGITEWINANRDKMG